MSRPSPQLPTARRASLARSRLASTHLLAATLLLAWAVAAGVLVDAASIILTLLTLTVAGVVFQFAARHLRADPARDHFRVEVAAFAFAVAAMALSANLLTFALGWVLSGRVLTSLVGHVRGWEDAELAAKRCSRIFMLSDLALISALVLLARATGSTAIAAVLAGIGQAPWAVTAAASALLVVAAAARCALPPFSHWLLRSLSTPTPVSALMHGGFVNAGGFLLLRFAPVMEAAPALRLTAVAIGLFAALYGVAAMSVRPDIKGALAASTVSQMGFMIASCGLGYYAAALWHLMAHGLFKGWLFLSSGSSAGIERNRPVVTLSGWAALSISTVTLVLGSILLRMFGEAPVPLLLAFATGAGVAVAARKSLRIIGAGALLVAAAAIGAESMRQWLLPSGPAPISAQAQLTIAAGMLGLWLALRFVAARGLPPALFVRLLNISSLKPAHSGAQA